MPDKAPATWASTVAGGQTRRSTVDGHSPPATSRAKSKAAARRPFIFQLPAIRGRRSVADKARYLVEVVGLSTVAAQIAANATTNPLIQSEFRVQEHAVSWSHDEGFSFKISAINYLEARAGGVAQQQAAEEAALQLIRSYQPSGPPDAPG